MRIRVAKTAFGSLVNQAADVESEVRPRVDEAYAELRRSVDDGIWKSLIDNLEQISSIDDGAQDRKSAEK